jgi:hypothetical protein
MRAAKGQEATTGLDAQSERADQWPGPQDEYDLQVSCRERQVVAPEEKHWLSTPLEAFAGRTPQELIADGRIRDLLIVEAAPARDL